MKSFRYLSLISAIALAGFFTIQAQPANAAVAISVPAVETPAVEAPAVSQVVPTYYYYHGRRYPYRYNGTYFGHRYYRGGRYRYY